MPGNIEIRALTGVRIIAATWVVIFHFWPIFVTLVPSLVTLAFIRDPAYLAVDLFFVLSGFVMTHQYFARFAMGGLDYRAFLIRRLARIYPTHILTLGALVLAAALAALVGHPPNSGDDTIGGAVQDALLIRGWVVPTIGWNFPTWSLSAEWFAYIAFPLLCLALMQFNAHGAAVQVVVVIALLAAEYASAELLRSFDRMPPPTVRVAIAFLLGCCTKVVTDRIPPSKWAGVFAGVSLLALLLVSDLVPSGGCRATFALTLSTVIVGGLAVGRGWFVRLLGSSLFEYGGRISFSLYVIHGACFIILSNLISSVSWSQLRAIGPLVSILLLIFLFALAAAAHRFIELPGHRLILRISTRVSARVSRQTRA